MLQGRELLEHRHDPVEGFLHPVVICLKPGVGASITERMETSCRPSPEADAQDRRGGGLKRRGSGRRWGGTQIVPPDGGKPIA
jgi:hypothetical protein